MWRPCTLHTHSSASIGFNTQRTLFLRQITTGARARELIAKYEGGHDRRGNANTILCVEDVAWWERLNEAWQPHAHDPD
jgi:hypothetical protein